MPSRKRGSGVMRWNKKEHLGLILCLGQRSECKHLHAFFSMSRFFVFVGAARVNVFQAVRFSRLAVSRAWEQLAYDGPRRDPNQYRD